MTIGQYYIERHYARGSSRELPPTPIQKLRALVSGREPQLGAAAPAPAPLGPGHGGGGGQ
jgi:polar amino acid transport system permease protein